LSPGGSRVLVIGAGIGGLTTAIALRRAGFEPAVFDRGAALERIQVGGGHHIYPNGVRVLQELDPSIVEEMRANGGIEQYLEFLDRRGNLLTRWPIGRWGTDLGAATIGIRRGKLHAILLRALGEDVLRLGRTCVGFEQDADGVTARFADGSEERGDALVGADGLRSVIREQVVGDGPPRYAGYTAWVGFTEFEHERLPYGHFRNVLGRGQRFLTLDMTPTVLGWSAIANSTEGGDGEAEPKREVLERFRGWLAPTEELVQSTPETAISRSDIYDRDPAAHWSVGRVTLLGDAAHPMTFNGGQGANQAIEDAFVLARCLAGADDVPAALRRYEEDRIPRTRALTILARRIGAAFSWENPATCRVRDAIGVRYVFGRLGARQFHKVVSTGPAAARARAVPRSGEILENPQMGARMIFRATADETDGELFAFEFFLDPRGVIAEEHLHPVQQERFEVLEGVVAGRMGGAERTARAGDVVVVPPGTPHVWWNAGDEVAHLLVEFRPALHTDLFFQNVFGLARDGKTDHRGVPSLLQLAVMINEHRDEVYPAHIPLVVTKAMMRTLAPIARLLGYRAHDPRYSVSERS
jgi:2-polyprenyl-6-methoxyphenol hydroxylase-like FAD-dependent oxidoreductase/quercetin dioxygenase-like cupin family protein